MPHTDNQTPEAAPAQPRADFWRQVFSNAKKQERRDIDLYDKFPRLYRDGEFGQPRDPSTVGERAGGGLTANFTFAYINLHVRNVFKPSQIRGQCRQVYGYWAQLLHHCNMERCKRKQPRCWTDSSHSCSSLVLLRGLGELSCRDC